MQNNIYSVSQVNKYIKNMFLTDYMLAHLEIKGEISNLKYHSTGHIYFTLKDEGGAIKGVMFASYARSLKLVLKEGMAVVVKGSCDVFERDGTYQIYAKEIRQEGIGNLFEEYEKLKLRLEELGMFDPMYKQPIPRYAKTLGVVTAPTGAAVRDIIDVSKRRNPGIQIILYPAIVQGPEAPLSIIKGINALEDYGVDVMIVGRGGGSIEDLWCFNDEAVAQTIFNCSVPIISAVGHETDFTIADFVSDMRAPTPSAAAELAVCDISVTLQRVSEYRKRFEKDINRAVYDARRTNAHLAQRLSLLSPKARVESHKKQLDYIKNSLKVNMEKLLTDRKHRLELYAGKMEGLSPLKRLSGGYSYVTGKEEASITVVSDVKAGDEIKVYVTDGIIHAEVTDTEEKKWTKKQ